jgi:hypothetical protein
VCRHFRCMISLARSLEEFTARHSNFQPKRHYISLSHIAIPEADILKQWFGGFDDSLQVRLKCYKGYQMEKDIVNRLIAIYGDRIQTEIEYSTRNGLFKCHPDFEFDEFPGDCKSVMLDSWLPEPGKLPRKVYWQMQAQMLYGRKDKAVVIYESRETGLLRDYWLKPNASVQAEIDAKVDRIRIEIPSVA